MTETNSDLSECIHILRAMHLAQLRLVDATIHSIMECAVSDGSKDNTAGLKQSTKAVLPLMIQSAGSSCHTILKLSEAPELPVRDCFPIARAVIETLINICFILAKGDAAAARMERHAMQKSFRDLSRTSTVAGVSISLEYSGTPNPATIPGMKEALEEFTTRRGDERRTWTEENIEARIKTIAERFGSKISMPLHVAQFAIYRHSSEILHGTYFGCMYFFGATQPGFERTGEQTRAALQNHLLLIFFNLVLALDAMIQSINEVMPIQQIAIASKRMCDQIQEIPLFKNELQSAG